MFQFLHLSTIWAQGGQQVYQSTDAWNSDGNTDWTILSVRLNAELSRDMITGWQGHLIRPLPLSQYTNSGAESSYWHKYVRCHCIMDWMKKRSRHSAASNFFLLEIIIYLSIAKFLYCCFSCASRFCCAGETIWPYLWSSATVVVQQQTPPTCKTMTKGHHGDPFPGRAQEKPLSVINLNIGFKALYMWLLQKIMTT